MSAHKTRVEGFYWTKLKKKDRWVVSEWVSDGAWWNIPDMSDSNHGKTNNSSKSTIDPSSGRKIKPVTRINERL